MQLYIKPHKYTYSFLLLISRKLPPAVVTFHKRAFVSEFKGGPLVL